MSLFLNSFITFLNLLCTPYLASLLVPLRKFNEYAGLNVQNHLKNWRRALCLRILYNERQRNRETLLRKWKTTWNMALILDNIARQSTSISNWRGIWLKWDSEILLHGGFKRLTWDAWEQADSVGCGQSADWWMWDATLHLQDRNGMVKVGMHAIHKFQITVLDLSGLEKVVWSELLGAVDPMNQKHSVKSVICTQTY